MKYTISITKEEYEFILAAVDAYVSNLREKMANQAQTWLIKQEGKKILAASTEVLRKEMDYYMIKNAPWGLKKDGTPKKQPGRQPRKAIK